MQCWRIPAVIWHFHFTCIRYIHKYIYMYHYISLCLVKDQHPCHPFGNKKTQGQGRSCQVRIFLQIRNLHLVFQDRSFHGLTKQHIIYLQRVVVFNPKGLLLNGIGLPSIWHPLEGPGMFWKIYLLWKDSEDKGLETALEHPMPLFCR